MRYALLALFLLLGVPTTAGAQISIGISIGAYPHFSAVAGFPVYYATDVESNYFFFDGLYWVYQGDNWYSSSWYDGPWDAIDPIYVPVYLLQVPVRYFRRPPMYFAGWQSDRAPRWGEHWGHDWDQRRSGWDRPRERLAPAPLPDYQRQYRGASYPKADQQRALRDENYKYRPQVTLERQPPADRARPVQSMPAQDRPPNRDAKRVDAHRPAQQPVAAPESPRPDARRQEPQRPAQRPEVQRPEAQRPAQQRPEAQRPEAQRPEAQRPAQRAPDRTPPQRDQKQPAPRQGEGGRQNGKRGQDDDRHPDR